MLLTLLILLTILAPLAIAQPDQEALLTAALKARTAGNYSEAKYHLEQLLLLIPTDENVHLLLASVTAEIERTRNRQTSHPSAPITSASIEEIDALVNAAAKSTHTTIAHPVIVSKEIRPAPSQAVSETIAPQAMEATSNTREQTRASLLQDVDRRWERPPLSTRVHTSSPTMDSEPIHDQMKRIHIPRINFSGEPLSHVVAKLTDLSEEHDPEKTGVNLILINHADTDPLVTITLRQLSLDRILDFVVESVGYEYEVMADGVVLRKAQSDGPRLETAFFSLSRSTLLRLTGVVTPQEQPRKDPFQATNEPAPDTVLPESEKALKNFLQRAGVPFDSVQGANLALADGQLIVTQSKRNLDRIRNILSRYDQIKQVEIETRFIEVQQGDLEELGFDWLVRTGGRNTFDPATGNPILTPTGDIQQTYNRSFNAGRTSGIRSLNDTFGGINQSGDNLIISSTQPDGKTVTTVDTVSGPQFPDSMDTAMGAIAPLADISGVIDSFDVNVMIRALSRKQGTDLMSAPKITVLSGKTAEIVVAQELRYPQRYSDINAQVGRGSSTAGSAGVAITTGTPQDFTTRNVGVEMTVTPTVEDDGTIHLVLSPEVTELQGYMEYGGPSIAIASNTTVKVPSGFSQPIFSVRRVRTEVTIWDGATVVMGGLTREQNISVNDKVPVLGDIPLLGRLFQSKGESAEKRNLLIFVTATLVNPGGAPTRVSPDDHVPYPYYLPTLTQPPEAEPPALPEKKYSRVRK